MKESPKPSEIILVVSGVLLFVFSFFSWVTLETDDDLAEIRDDIEEQIDDARDDDAPDEVIESLEDQLDDFNEDAPGGGWNAWGGSPDFGRGSDSIGFPGLFPIATFAAIFGLGVAVVVALKLFTSTNLPANVIGFSWTQLYLVAGVYAALVTLSFVILDKSFGQDDGGAGTGIGLWLSLLASAGLIVGAVMALKDDGAEAGPAPQAPPQNF